MSFRTEVNFTGPRKKISYRSKVMFAGSCFAAEMAGKMREGLMPVACNPSGVVYNPSSAAETLRNLIAGKVFNEDDLWNHKGKWLSFSHYTDFSSLNREECLARINSSCREASIFLKNAEYLFVTFGTARIYRRTDTGVLVSNCHKIPQSFFVRELLSPSQIADEWNILLTDLGKFNPGLSVVFTVSPVRHWKDGAHGNQVSKSVLFMAIEELLRHKTSPGYFPSYEIMMDDLRDYRFYGDDLLHPSTRAVEYIWEKFSGAFLDDRARSLWKEVSAITRASRHRTRSSETGEVEEFRSVMLNRIDSLEAKAPEVDFSPLREFFNGRLK